MDGHNMTWRLARALQTLRTEVRTRWPETTVWTVGDADHAGRPSDHNPNDHDNNPATAAVVSAIDVVGRTQAAAVWDHLVATRDPRVEYMIHRGRVTGSDHGWVNRPYTGSNPHLSHLHVSVGRGTDSRLTRPDLFDDPSPWGVADMTEGVNVLTTQSPDGPAIERLQQALLAWNPAALPAYGADSDYGSETAEWVKRYQAAMKLTPTGNADGVTLALLLDDGPSSHDHDSQYAPKSHRHDGRYARTSHPHTATIS